MEINEFFDKVYVINLKRRLDRRMEILEEVETHGITIDIVEAVDGQEFDWSEYPNVYPIYNGHDLDNGGISKNIAGLAKTHESILKDAIDKGYERILILEDDAEFAENLTEVFTDTVAELPDNWDMFYLGSQNFIELPKPYSTLLGKTCNTLGLHAIGISKKAYQTLLDSIDFKFPIDVNYMKKANSMNSFVALEQIVWQRPSYSDLLNLYVSYGRHTAPVPEED